MININTIISSFDEEGTLLKWLKKVEDALKNASLKTVATVTIDDTSFQLKFIFADDTYLLSPTITSPKGTKGDTGPQGPQGPAGPAGSDANVTAENVNAVMEGSADIVVDMNETNDKVAVRLDDTFKNSLANKDELLDNATLELKTNTDGDATINLVAEFGDKSKVNSPVAFKKEDFVIQNNHIALKSSGSGTRTFYIHMIEIQSKSFSATIEILNTLNVTADNAELLASMLNKNDHYSALLSGTVLNNDTTKFYQLNDIAGDEAGNVTLYYINESYSKSTVIFNSTTQVIDTMQQLL